MKTHISVYKRIAVLTFLDNEIEIFKLQDSIGLRYRNSGKTVDSTLNEVYLQICERYCFNTINDKYLHDQVRNVINLAKRKEYAEGIYFFHDFINIPNQNLYTIINKNSTSDTNQQK